MFKCFGIRKPDPLTSPDRGTLKIKKESSKFLLILSLIRGEIERGLVLFQQLLIKERRFKMIGLWKLIFKHFFTNVTFLLKKIGVKFL